MRVAYIVSQFPLLSQGFILDQVGWLANRRHDITILTRLPLHQQAFHRVVESHRLMERVCCLDPTAGFPKGVRRRLARARMVSGFALRHPSQARALRRYARQNALMPGELPIAAARLEGIAPFEIIHGFPSENAMLACHLRQANLITGKIVVTCDTDDVYMYLRKLDQNARPFLFDNAGLLLISSDAQRDELLRLGCPENKAVVHRHGVAPGELDFPARMLSEDGVTRFLAVATLDESAGLEHAIRAARKLLDRKYRLRLTIIGNGPARAQLEAVTAELQIVNHVKFAGARTPNEVRETMAASHVLISPGVTTSDRGAGGIPPVVIEAMAARLPVLATRLPGTSEQVIDGETGFLVEEQNEEALLERMAWFADHPEEWAGLGEAGRKRVEAMNDSVALNEQLGQHFEKLISGGTIIAS